MHLTPIQISQGLAAVGISLNSTFEAKVRYRDFSFLFLTGLISSIRYQIST